MREKSLVNKIPKNEDVTALIRSLTNFSGSRKHTDPVVSDLLGQAAEVLEQQQHALLELQEGREVLVTATGEPIVHGMSLFYTDSQGTKEHKADLRRVPYADSKNGQWGIRARAAHVTAEASQKAFEDMHNRFSGFPVIRKMNNFPRQ